MKTFKGAVIGIGGIGIWHAKLMRDTGRIEVVALCDVSDGLRDKALKDFPQARFYTSHEAMFAREQLDLVAISTPHDLHQPLAIAALRAAANVIVEKPMATTYEGCLTMMDAARKCGRFLTVFHNRRLDGWFLAAKSVIIDGYLGRIVHISSGINYAPGPETWRGYKKASGGLMFDWGCHIVDYVLHLADDQVESVSGFLYKSPEKGARLVEDHGTVRICFRMGVVGDITISALSLVEPPRYRIVGDKGTLIDEWKWGDTDKLTVQTRLSGGEMGVMHVGYRKTVAQKYYDNIAANLAGEQPLMVSAESAARVINVLCTAEHSNAQGGVPLPLA